MSAAEDRSPEPGSWGEERDRLVAENQRLERRVAELERKISLQPQTGLPTHFRLELELEETIERMKRAGGPCFAILIVQLGDTYTIVRKTLKTSVSEWILYQTGCRIAGLLGAEDKVFHTRENEFVLILHATGSKELVAFLRKLDATLVEPHIFSGFNVVIKAATGVSLWPDHGAERSALLHSADIAAGAATERRKPFVMFKPELLQHAVEKVELQNAIIKAIEQPALDHIGDQFTLFFQPKLFASGLDGDELAVERIEAEALIRWKHPERGLLMPSTFIPLAEETGLILPIGKWLIYQCARRLAEWSQRGREATGVSINLSARQFRSEELLDILSSAIGSVRLPANLVTVELTETALFEEPEAAAAALERFSALGLRISVDDFGTGYSSLSHLHRFPLDEIKIDRLFVEHVDTRRQDRVIVRSLVSIAKGLGLSLVAEGVERSAALRILWDMGCRGYQGYLIAKPLPAEEFLAFRDRIISDGMRFRLPNP